MIGLITALAGCTPPVLPPPDLRPTSVETVDGEIVVDTGWTGVVDEGCRPDADPGITEAELAFDPAITGSYRGARAPADPDAWDFTGVGEEPLLVGVRAIDDFWFASGFTDVTYVSALDLDETEWGVYRSDAEGLWLLGLASDEPGSTALVYDTPVRLWSWPLDERAPEVTRVQANGLLEGETYPQTFDLLLWDNTVVLLHEVAVEVVSGSVAVDAGTYPAQRVAIRLDAWGHDDFDNEYGRQQSHTWLFVTACAGVVARITDDEFMGLGL